MGKHTVYLSHGHDSPRLFFKFHYRLLRSVAIPHFEKMLYDQGQLVNVYLDVFSITKDVFYASIARDVLDYLRRDMIGPEGEIYSAEDADSAEPEDGTRKKEEAFYIWSSKEVSPSTFAIFFFKFWLCLHNRCLFNDVNFICLIVSSTLLSFLFYFFLFDDLFPVQVDDVLGEDATLFKNHYYIKPAGNCDLSRMSDPQSEFKGKNVLIERKNDAEASKFSMSVEEYLDVLGQSRRKLFEIRCRRPRPHLDDKVLLSQPNK